TGSRRGPVPNLSGHVLAPASNSAEGRDRARVLVPCSNVHGREVGYRCVGNLSGNRGRTLSELPLVVAAPAPDTPPLDDRARVREPHCNGDSRWESNFIELVARQRATLQLSALNHGAEPG